jgi:hypothetical protein
LPNGDVLWFFTVGPDRSAFFPEREKICLRIREYKIVLPDIKTMFFQLCIASADLIFASAILYSLLRERLSGNIGFAAFCGIFVLSLFAGVVSQVPGGLVFLIRHC